MNSDNYPEIGWMLRSLLEAVEWLNPIVLFIGLVIAVWAFFRCRKWGYLVIAVYFLFMLIMPPINRLIRAHHRPDISEQMRKKLDAAVQEAVDKVLAAQGPQPQQRTIHFPFWSMLLVSGLWLIARRETKRPEARQQTETTPASSTG